MKDAEWIKCANLDRLVKFLRGRTSGRELRRFAAACARRHWHQLKDDRLREAVELAERTADGQASEDELALTHGQVWEAVKPDPDNTLDYPSGGPQWWEVRPRRW